MAIDLLKDIPKQGYTDDHVKQVTSLLNEGKITLGDAEKFFGVPADTIQKDLEAINSGQSQPTGSSVVGEFNGKPVGVNASSSATVPVVPRNTAQPSEGVTPTTATPEQLERQTAIRTGLDQIASGRVGEVLPGNNLAATPTNMTGTITPDSSIQKIGNTPIVTAGTVAPTTKASTATADTSLQSQAAGITTNTIDNIAQVASVNPFGAAEGVIDEAAKAVRDDSGLSGANQATAAQLSPEEIAAAGAEVNAVVGTLNPSDIAEAAKVAGLEAARIDMAKNQLRKAGLTEAQIATFGNDPSSLELKLTDFTEAQRGVIGGLPEEALVSTQMEQLLAGLESGNIPTWAKPAVDAVNQMLASRGMSISTIGRDTLTNALIQAAMPIAQSNAQSIKESVLQQKDSIARQAVAEAQMKQQAILQNAQNSFGLNIRNLDATQQAELANKQFLQTATITNVNNRQQTAIQNAVNLTQLDAEMVDHNTRLAINNANAFLQMDLTNLSNEQQGLVIDTQFNQQRMLTNASAENVAKQFNASSKNQTEQFMSNLAATIAQFNVQQANAMSSFNATEKNKMNAFNTGNEIQVAQFNTQLMAQVDQFNAQQELQREQWNAANAQAIEQSNVQWRRQANTADTAAQNAINQQNVQNAFNLTAQGQAALWQELRDQAAFDQQAYQNKEDREAQLYASAIGNEAAAAESFDQTTHLVNLAKSFFGS